eukprot:COSAG02_NODE_27058_length_618_cov_0.678227_2_plen_102_part_01
MPSASAQVTDINGATVGYTGGFVCTVSTLAGGASGNADAIGTLATFHAPHGLALSSNTTFALIADSSNHRIRKITTVTGQVTTVAGSSAGSLDGTGTTARFN